MAVQLKRRRFTVDDYHRMARAGILHEDDRVELIDGEIVEMTPIGPRHAFTNIVLPELLRDAIRGRAVVSVQNPVRLDRYNEPEPDVALLRSPVDRYAERLPAPTDVLLVVEVGETTAALDRRVKVPLYGRTGIPELWLIDLKGQTVTVYRTPTPDGYESVRVLRPGESLAPAAFPDSSFEVAAILGRAQTAR